MSRTLLSALVLPVLGCTQLKPIEPAALLQSNSPSSVEVSVAGSGQLLVRAPRLVSPDTLAGLVNDHYETIPLSRITEVRARQAAPLRTALLIGIPVVIGGAITVYELTKDNTPTGTVWCVYDATLNLYLC